MPHRDRACRTDIGEKACGGGRHTEDEMRARRNVADAREMRELFARIRREAVARVAARRQGGKIVSLSEPTVKLGEIVDPGARQRDIAESET
jgi:hypothetical protein